MKATACKLATASAAVLSMTSLAWAQGQGGADGYAYGPHMMWGGWYGMVLGPLFFILVLLALFAGVALILRWIGAPGHGPHPTHHAPPPGRTPLDILKERFARGEIDKEEYEERRRVLGE